MNFQSDCLISRVGFIHVKIGPDTPQIGTLLRTTCDDESGLEDHGVEVGEENILEF
jgi:hypothetical protein